MTAGELIEKLKTVDPDMEVVVCAPDSGYYTDEYYEYEIDEKETVDGMRSDDYKERFLSEYNQLTVRITKLSKMLDKYENKQLEYELKSPIVFYYQQLSHMIAYQQALRNRALVEFHEVL